MGLIGAIESARKQVAELKSNCSNAYVKRPLRRKVESLVDLQREERLAYEEVDVLRTDVNENARWAANNSYLKRRMYESQHKLEAAETTLANIRARIEKVKQQKSENEKLERKFADYICVECNKSFTCESCQLDKVDNIVCAANDLANVMGFGERLKGDSHVICEKCLKAFLLKLERFFCDLEAKFRNGNIVEGIISRVEADDVYVDIGYKAAGIIGIDEFASVADDEVPVAKVGDKVMVMIVKLEDEKTGMPELSKRRADDKIRWEKILERYEEGDIVTGRVKSVVRGGLIVLIDDVEAYLPSSQIEIGPVVELESYVGRTVKCQIIKMSNERRNIVVSRCAIEERQEGASSIHVGDVVKGEVQNIQPYGAFITFDGHKGLLHISEMSWGYVKDPHDILKAGQTVTAKVVNVDASSNPPRIALSLKQLEAGPGQNGVNCRVDRYGINPILPKDRDVLVDGSNIIWWFSGSNAEASVPALRSKALCLIMALLEKAGYSAHVFFDATIPYVLDEKGDAVGKAFLAFLKTQKPELLTVVPGGSSADDYILMLADRKGSHIISNDRFSQYVARYPWVKNKETEGKRVHRVEVVDGELMLPSLGLSVSVESPEFHNRLRKVTFTVREHAGKLVFLAGDFNQWNPQVNEMIYNPDAGVYAVTIDLAAGSHQYKFLIDGVWCLDPENAETADDGLGGRNSKIIVS